MAAGLSCSSFRCALASFRIGALHLSQHQVEDGHRTLGWSLTAEAAAGNSFLKLWPVDLLRHRKHRSCSAHNRSPAEESDIRSQVDVPVQEKVTQRAGRSTLRVGRCRLGCRACFLQLCRMAQKKKARAPCASRRASEKKPTEQEEEGGGLDGPSDCPARTLKWKLAQ